MTPTDDLTRLVAHEDIRQLAYRYAWLLDSRDLTALADLFVPDVRVGEATGRAALAASFSDQLAAIGPTTLFVGNHLIELDDADHAHGVVYCRGYIDEPDAFVEQMIVYSDKYRRVPGEGWRFVGRRHELFYGVETAERPYEQRAAHWPDHATGVGTLPFRLPTWQRFREEAATVRGSEP